MDLIKKGDFVEIEYTGKIKESGELFDTTDEQLAKDHDLFSEKMNYGAVVIKVGLNQVIKGLDSVLEDRAYGLHCLFTCFTLRATSLAMLVSWLSVRSMVLKSLLLWCCNF